MSCTNKDLYASLEVCPGKKVLPGIKSRLYFVPKSSIVKYPELPDIESLEKGGDFSTLAVYKDDFTLASDKKWRYIDIVVDKSSFSCESQGDKPSKTFINKLTAKVSDMGVDATAFARMANDDDFVFLVSEKHGKTRVFGNDMYDTNVKPKMDSGATATDESGTTLEIEVTDICPAPFYVGKIETEDGDISGDGGGAITEK